MKKPIIIHIAVRDLMFKIRRGAAGKGRTGFTFADRSKYNRNRSKESRERF